jgi:acetyl-CoA synthetase
MSLLFLACVQYAAMYRRSVEDPDFFWAEIASGFYWKTKWETRDGNKIHSENIDVRKARVAIEVRITTIMLLAAMISKLNNNNILA